MLHFYAAWCGPCLKELPLLLDAQAELMEMGISVVALTDDGQEQIEQLRKHFSIDFPIYQLQGNLRTNGIPSIPTTFIINEKGKIFFSISGPADWSNPELLTEIQQKLDDSF